MGGCKGGGGAHAPCAPMLDLPMGTALSNSQYHVRKNYYGRCMESGLKYTVHNFSEHCYHECTKCTDSNQQVGEVWVL